jgi:hypothetical protein
MEALRIGKIRITGLAQLRRLVLLLAVCMASAAVAYWFPQVMSWNHAALVVFAVSFLAGFTALWSP